MVNGGQMNIDERIEALTQSVELLASMHKDNEKKMNEFASKHADLEGLVIQIAEGVTALIQVANDHQRRISDLEDGNRPRQ